MSEAAEPGAQFCAELKRARLVLGLTITECAKRAKMDLGNWRRIEKGKSVTFYTAARMCAAVGARINIEFPGGSSEWVGDT